MNNLSTSIATTREQSERLLAMGVKPEMADMTYHNTKSSVKVLEWELKPYPPTLKSTTRINIARLSSPLHKRPDGSQMTGEEVFESIWGKDIPAWSLSRLISMMPMSLNHRKSEYSFSLHFCYDDKTFSMQYDRYVAFNGLESLESKESESLIECCISMIEWLIKNNHFNKEYLK